MATQKITLTAARGHLNAIVTAENSVDKELAPHYPPITAYLAGLLETNDQAGIHAFLCKGQDDAKTGTVWNRVLTALRKSLASNTKPIVFTKTRHYDPNYRKNKPLFELAYRVDVNQAKREQEKKDEERARELERETELKNLAERLAADQATTAHDIAVAAYEECKRLGLDVSACIVHMMDLANENASASASASMARATEVASAETASAETA